MPTCYCTVRGCQAFGGRDVSLAVLKTHSLDEKMKEAEIQTQWVEDNQLEQLTVFMAANTLSDKVSGPSTTLGGRFWGKDVFSGSEALRPEYSLPPQPRQNHTNSHKPLSSTSSPGPQMSRRSREKEILSCLIQLRREIHLFSEEVDSALLGLHRPSSKVPPTTFPLHGLLDKASSLNDRLAIISFESPTVMQLKEPMETDLCQIANKIQEAESSWNLRLSKIQRIKTPSHGLPFDANHHYQPILLGVDPILHVTFFMTIACEIVLGVSRRGCTFLLEMIQCIINLTVLRAGPQMPLRDQKLLSDIPADIRRAESQFHLKPNCTIVAVCPNQDCHATYNPTFSEGSPVPTYPKLCTYRQTHEAEQCGTELLEPRRIQGQIIYLPIKTFVRNNFKDWLAGLLSRNGFEEKMDGAWASCRQQTSKTSDDMKDIFDGEVLQNFMGPDGRHFCLGGEEGRYVFLLCVDYFNPLGNKQAGKKKSVGMVSLVCLNIPPDMRYKPENMFLYGIIPGPQEPPLACLNHYLKFLVDEFLEFWSPGIRFSRTSKYYYGRVVLCALVCLVCDLIGARKTAGFAGLRHNQMCALCHCTRQQHGYGNTNVNSWQRRTGQEYRDGGRRFQDATSEKQRENVVNETGIRWSELLRLPYFDPSRFVVVDAMHNLFLGLIQEHFEILGIKLEQKKEEVVAVDVEIDPDLIAALDAASKKTMSRLLRILRSPLKERLEDKQEYKRCLDKISNCHLSTLKTACISLDIQPSLPTNATKTASLCRKDYARALLLWRLSQLEYSSESPTFRKGCILTEEEVETIRADIANMITPSWLTSVPHDLGEPRHGKLKADQWRILATTYLPISLVQMWGKLNDDANDKPSRHQKLLDATISLISAVIIATSRTTSCWKADLYLQHMQSYLNVMHELIPDYVFRPNHHMSLHLAEYLRLFGPVHAWWTFPFERLIGMLPRIPTNFKMGELEETMTTSFIKSANLRALVLKDVCPPTIKNCQPSFERLLHTDIRNSILIDVSSSTSDPENDLPPEPDQIVKVSESTHRALRIYFSDSMPKILRNRTFYTHEGRTFATASRHRGNSAILVKSSDGSHVPAQIQEILQISSTEVVLAVRHYRKAKMHDPFAKYPFLHISLWSASQGNIVIVRIEDVVAHFASMSFSSNNDCLAIVSLLREY